MSISKIKKTVLKKVKPSKQEIQTELAKANEIIEKINTLEGFHLEVILAGSLSRSTHLKGDRDLDIFVLFPEKMSRKDFEKEGLRIGKEVFGNNPWEEAYSEHPYIRGEIDGYKIEIVPSYIVKKAELLQSAVDRTPFHTKYLQNKLTEKQKDEVRLLRQFLKGINCYGADLRFSSVPGIVTELLIIHYGSFDKTIKAISNWKYGEVVDLEKNYSEKEALKKFDAHFIVVDPVDKNRNVAAALSLNQYSRIIAAARSFLKKPSLKFFFGKKEKSWTQKKLKEMLLKKELIAIQLGYPEVIGDIVWGQIKRIRKKLMKQLELLEFKLIRGDEWTDEKEKIVILIELESRILQKATIHRGPFVTDKKNSEVFLNSHKKVLSGPRIEDGRWVIEIPRKYTTIENYLKDYFKELKTKDHVNLRKAITKKFKILEEPDIIKLFEKDKEFSKFLTTYLEGKEEFLIL